MNKTRPVILVLDESRTFCRTLAKVLEEHGFTVAQAYSWEEAEDVIEKTGIDMVLLNLTVFKEEGLAMLSMIREQKPDLPVIILGTHNDHALSFEGRRLGAVDYFTIPLNVEELIKVIGGTTDNN
ncbi:MAG: response regulator [Desulfonatronovibrio sp. MSAO_Bac4]|nr:MAG: response regulator [Desulfonatronovibrio sp. MSAO_Bac4]